MRSIRQLTSTAAIALTAFAGAGAVLSPIAAASHGQVTYFDATTQLINSSTRAHAFEQMRSVGVHAIRLMLEWDLVAPAAQSARKPKFAATEPSSYNWSAYLPALEEAKRLHWPVLLTVTSPVPVWASGNHRDHFTRPNAQDFKEFMTAAAKELAPYVSVWAIWNEPNQLAWLQPQWNHNGSPASPAIYRRLFLAGYAGLRAGGLASPKVLFGETAPFGESHINARKEGVIHQMAPLEFMRAALCLNAQYHRVGHCSMLPASGYGHHAYPNASGPSYQPPNRDQVTIGTLGRLTHALNLAAQAHAIRSGIGIYLTEFGINTRPNPLGVTPLRQAQFDAISEMIAWKNPRVASFGQYQLQDDAVPKRHSRQWTGFQTGLETAGGQRKPLFYSFPIPLVVSRAKHGFAFWGHVRLASGPTVVDVLVQSGRGRRFRLLRSFRTNQLGYWQGSSPVRGVAWKVRWRSPQGLTYEGPALPAS